MQKFIHQAQSVRPIITYTAYVDSAGTCFCDAANCQGGNPTCYDENNAICEPAAGSCSEVETIDDLNYPIGLDIGVVACANDPDGDALTYTWDVSNYSNDWEFIKYYDVWFFCNRYCSC